MMIIIVRVWIMYINKNKYSTEKDTSLLRYCRFLNGVAPISYSLLAFVKYVQRKDRLKAWKIVVNSLIVANNQLQWNKIKIKWKNDTRIIINVFTFIIVIFVT